jgi:ABC-type nitrate/sulfonate/bicarbonate transport system substrate-binding protein
MQPSFKKPGAPNMKPKIYYFARNKIFLYACLAIWFCVCITRVQAQERIRIGISSVSPGFIPTIVAEKKGFYTKYGLRSEHVIISLAVAINALGTGDLDCVVSVAQGVSAALRGFPVKLVMMTEDKLDFFLMTKPDIRSVADLKGKVVGISYPGSTTHLVAEAILRHFNLEPGRDVSLFPTGDNQARLVALETGRVAATIGTPPYNVLAPAKGLKVLLWARDYVAIPQNGLIVTDKKIQQSPDQLKRMIKGTIEALQFIRRDKEESIDIAAKWMQLDRPRVKAVLESVFPLYSADGTMTDVMLQAALDVEVQRGKIERKVALSEIADRTLLLEAQKELGIK